MDYITVPMERYAELITLEKRAEELAEYIQNTKMLVKVDMFYILGRKDLADAENKKLDEYFAKIQKGDKA